jgi:CRISPR system Cascade subunit CasE
MTLFMLRLDPDLTRATRWGAQFRLAPPGAEQGYLWHALLTAAFGALAPKAWRLIEPERAAPRLLGYSAADEAALREYAALYADPAATAALGVETLAMKAMPSAYRAGQRFGFEVRLRPVVRSSLRLDGANERGGRDHRIEIDIGLHAALAARARDPTAPPPDVEALYKTWLAERLGRAGARADPADMKLLWRRRAVLMRRDAERRLSAVGRKGGGPDICVAGVLDVTDPNAFAALLAQGVGRHRAFGFGMLLLKPAG